MFLNLIFGGWVGFILIVVSMIMVNKGYEKVKSAFKIYIVGLILIIFNLGLMWSLYFMAGYILIVIALIGLIISLIFLKKIKSLVSNQILVEDVSSKKDEISEEVDKVKKRFKILSLISIIIFLISAFIPFPRYDGFLFLGIYYIFGGWEGFVFILISTILVYSDYDNRIITAFYLYLIGVILIGLNSLLLFFSNTIFFATIPTIVYFISLITFILSLSALKKAKHVVLERDQILFCPRCKHKNKGDVSSCDSCDLNLTEFPALSYSHASHLRYCPRCQKNVQPKKKFGIAFWIALIFLIIFVFTVVGGIGIIAIIGLLLITAISSPKCSNCKKKTQLPQFTTTPQMAPNTEVQE